MSPHARRARLSNASLLIVLTASSWGRVAMAVEPRMDPASNPPAEHAQAAMETEASMTSVTLISTTMLSGAQEVPPIDTKAFAKNLIVIEADGSVSGDIETSQLAGTAAHIHAGAAGTNGPVLVTLAKTADNRWSVPAGTKLTPTQYESFRAGNLYANVHSAEHPSGEIRVQLKQP